MKLTKPLAKSKNANIQKINIGRVKKIDEIRVTEENISIVLKTSPVNIKSPLRNKSPAQNKMIVVGTPNPNIKVNKAKDDIKSNVPRILTNM